jgi:hypothetical protein
VVASSVSLPGVNRIVSNPSHRSADSESCFQTRKSALVTTHSTSDLDVRWADDEQRRSCSTDLARESEQKGLSTAMSENRQTNAVAHPIFSL